LQETGEEVAADSSKPKFGEFNIKDKVPEVRAIEGKL